MADTTPSDAQDFVTAQVDLQVAGTRVQFALTVSNRPGAAGRDLAGLPDALGGNPGRRGQRA